MFIGGVFFIFVAQELVPLLPMLRRNPLQGREPDPRLHDVLAKTRQAYRAAGFLQDGRRTPPGYTLPGRLPVAALHGLRSPSLVVSEGLLKTLDETELETVLAHEFAHYHYGGNLRTLVIWVARALQGFNPAALILFRELLEARELACDALAAQVTGKPRVLAAALLKFHVKSPSSKASTEVDRFKDARRQLRERAETDAIELRHRALMNPEALAPALSWGWLLPYGLTLGGLLWLIG